MEVQKMFDPLLKSAQIFDYSARCARNDGLACYIG